ncbi:MAG: DUF3413 domain-containing protein [Pseudomonadota bacterium]|nr:DUF3413 domain-containing protein [Pseudomonadota bacterium]
MNKYQNTFPFNRLLLLRWLGWFGLATGFTAALIGARYLLAFGLPGSMISGIYVFSAYMGHFVVLGVVPMIILLGPIAVIVPSKRLIMTLAVLLAGIILSLIVLDTNIFNQYRYHLSRLTIEIFDVSTWIFFAVIFSVLSTFQFLIGENIWQRLNSDYFRIGKKLGVGLFLIWVTGQSVHIWADASAYSPVTSFNRYLPAYYPIKAKRRLAQLGLMDPSVIERQRLLQSADSINTQRVNQLNYPMNDLRCIKKGNNFPDILFVLVDALRPDKISRELTPRIYEFASRSQNFSQQYSGGNSSRMGIFSLFYGLPSTYWQTFYELQQSPVLFQQLKLNDYQIVGFSSVGFGSPAQIDRTVFSEVDGKNLWAPDEETIYKNDAITEQWQSWLETERNSQKPFFGFLYYDPGNAFKQSAQSNLNQNELDKKINSYLDGINAVDKLLTQLLDHLEIYQNDRETIIIIASDHGYEFDELGLGYVGHASNYGRYQLQSTLLIDWPGKPAKTYTHRSAHQDLPVTLMQDVLGCENPASDFSSGVNLFTEKDWEWFIAGSYNSHAIIEPDKLVVTYPGGMIDLLDNDYLPLENIELNAVRIEEALLEMRRFYQ